MPGREETPRARVVTGQRDVTGTGRPPGAMGGTAITRDPRDATGHVPITHAHPPAQIHAHSHALMHAPGKPMCRVSDRNICTLSGPRLHWIPSLDEDRTTFSLVWTPPSCTGPFPVAATARPEILGVRHARVKDSGWARRKGSDAAALDEGTNSEPTTKTHHGQHSCSLGATS